MINKLIVLGGGTAGLISALCCKHAFPKLDVTLIESKDIGIIGVGEGSTEHWAHLMEYLEIDIPELLRETDATFKTGIRFNNWHGDNTEYWHALAEFTLSQDPRSGLYLSMVDQIANGEDALASVWKETLESRHAGPFSKSVNQFHFDTKKLNDYFHKKCENKGVIFINDTIDDVELDESGFVSKLHGKQIYTADFFIDCSGFRRVIASKLGVKWIDCKDYLPMNSAIAFPTGYKEDIPSHTEARALSSGWMWRIPTQNRFGNGYVYCDDFINEDEAISEAQSQHSDKIEIAKKIKFSAGYLDENWTKNCVCVGLASMFVEPLEATSIGSTIQQMFGLITSLPHWHKNDKTSAKIYNKRFKQVSENIIDFVQIHYITERRDSEFWRWINSDLILTDFNREYLDDFKKYLPSHQPFNDHFIMFKSLNYTQVMWGLRLLDRKEIANLWGQMPHLHKKAYNIRQGILPQTVKHREAINLAMQGIDFLDATPSVNDLVNYASSLKVTD